MKKPELVFATNFDLDSIQEFRDARSKYDFEFLKSGVIITTLPTDDVMDYMIGSFIPFDRTRDMRDYEKFGVRYVRFDRLPNGERILLEDMANVSCIRYVRSVVSELNKIATPERHIGIILPTEMSYADLRRTGIMNNILTSKLENLLSENGYIDILIENTHVLQTVNGRTYFTKSSPKDVSSIVKYLRSNINTERIGLCVNTSEYTATEFTDDIVVSLTNGTTMGLSDPFTYIKDNKEILKLIVAGTITHKGNRIEDRCAAFTEDNDNYLKLLANVYKQEELDVSIVMNGSDTASAIYAGNLLMKKFEY